MKVVFLPIKGIVNFEITIIIINPGPSTCRNGEHKGNLLLFSFNSGSDFFCFVSYSFHRTLPYYFYVQNSFRSVCLSTHVTLENIRTCGLLKIINFICSRGVSPLLVDEFTGRAWKNSCSLRG